MSGRRSRGPSPSPSRRALGRFGEDLAERYLRSRGVRILARNLHLRYAELDLLALDGETLCFIEVRLRSSDRFGSAEESVDVRKQRRLARAARAVLSSWRLPRFRQVRFDVVAVDSSSTPPEIRLTQDAFYLDR